MPSRLSPWDVWSSHNSTSPISSLVQPGSSSRRCCSKTLHFQPMPTSVVAPSSQTRSQPSINTWGIRKLHWGLERRVNPRAIYTTFLSPCVVNTGEVYLRETPPLFTTNPRLHDAFTLSHFHFSVFVFTSPQKDLLIYIIYILYYNIIYI